MRPVNFCFENDLGHTLSREVEEIIEKERECCPFLDWVLEDAGQETFRLTITGSEDARAMLRGLLGDR